jgi:DNA-binding transcriptional regulator YiaG
MSNFASQFKAEIQRLSKKEVRQETQQLKKSSTQYRADIAALKRRIASLEASIKRLQKLGATRSQAAGGNAQADADADLKLRFRREGFANLRKKLDISAADMGKLLGVSGQSVYHWETGKARPRASQLPAIAAVRKLGKKALAARLAELG